MSRPARIRHMFSVTPEMYGSAMDATEFLSVDLSEWLCGCSLLRFFV